MKKTICVLLALFLLVSLAGCGSGGNTSSGNTSETENKAAENAEESEEPAHKIAVLVYNYSDDEVASFRKYLVDYIAPIFNVEFVYSGSSMSLEDSLNFLNDAAAYGVEGVMSFVSYDLKAEVELCAEKDIFYMLASGTVSNADFASVEDDPHFLGVVGPGSFIEYKAGSDLANHFYEQKAGDSYFILSGGAAMGNEMHALRTQGILDTLATAYGVHFDCDTEAASRTEEPLELTCGDLTVFISPGYVTRDAFFERMQQDYKDHPYGIVLSVLPVARMQETLNGAKIGVVDCYSENNLQQFASGNLDYLVGKYSSIIGPSFAAMYNAITGNADFMRENGKAFHVTQGYWISGSREDFEDKYTLASSIEINAYNYEDLQKVIRLYNEDATLGDLKELALAYTYEAAAARRGME